MSFSKAKKSLSKAITHTLSGPVANALPESMRETFLLRLFGLLKIPMLSFISPSVVEMSESRCEIRVPLNRRTRNHLKSMYFGTLAAGADCAGGLIAMRVIQEEGDKVSLIFKDFHADFLKRAEGDVHFVCTEGKMIRELVHKALASGERENMSVHITATVPSKLGQEPIANFILTLSLKRKKP